MHVVSCAPPAARAGEGNRTPITSLEGWGSTVELHPHASRSGLASVAVGARGFEPPTPCSQSRCATRLRHAPPRPELSIAGRDESLNYGRRRHGLYLLVEEAASEGGKLFRVGAADVGGLALVVDVPRAAETVPARKDAAHLQGGLTRGGDKAHLRTQDAVYGSGDQGVVGTAEHDGVDATLHDGLEITSRHPFELGTVDDAAFDHGHELGAGLLVDLDPRIEGVHGAPVRATRRRQGSREYADAPVTRLLHRRPRPGLDDTNNRHLEGSLRGPEGRSRRRVASDHDQLHVHADEVVDDLEGEPPYLGEVTYPVRHPSRIPEVHGVLVGQTVLDLREHRQPADTRIEHSDWPWITHGTGLYPASASPSQQAACGSLSARCALRACFQPIRRRPYLAAHENRCG